MNTALWLVQALLSALMIVLGLMKTFLPVEQLHQFSWTTRSPDSFVRFVGISELLIGAGLILPQLTGILPMLTSLAALCLCLIMVLALSEHLRYKEIKDIPKNVIILLLAAFVVVGRLYYFNNSYQ